MPHFPRFRLPGEPFHVYQRGHNKSAVFLDETCFLVYLGLLAQMSPRYACWIHAYVLMTNHVHLLVTGDHEDSISLMMKAVNERFGRFFNKRFGRVGPVWQSRFRSNVVETTEYFATCSRYIELNPVRARMVATPADYAWCSYRLLGLGEPCAFLRPHPIYLALGRDDRTRQARYRKMVAEPLSDEAVAAIRVCVRTGIPFGRDEYRKELAARFGVRTELLKPGPRNGQPATSRPQPVS